EEAGICPGCGADLFSEILPLQRDAPRAVAPHPSRTPRRLPPGDAAPTGPASGSPHRPALVLGLLAVTLAVGTIVRHSPGRSGGTDIGEVARKDRAAPPQAGAGESAAPAGPAGPAVSVVN